ncbi:MAG: hypothetical protein ACKESB_02875 [Candidatus Hodgkinia cicadicola]
MSASAVMGLRGERRLCVRRSVNVKRFCYVKAVSGVKVWLVFEAAEAFVGDGGWGGERE